MAANVLESVTKKTVVNTLPVHKPPRDSLVRSLSAEDQVLLTRLLTEPAFFVDHPDFDNAQTEKTLFGSSARLINRLATRFRRTCSARRTSSMPPRRTVSSASF